MGRAVERNQSLTLSAMRRKSTEAFFSILRNVRTEDLNQPCALRAFLEMIHSVLHLRGIHAAVACIALGACRPTAGYETVPFTSINQFPLPSRSFEATRRGERSGSLFRRSLCASALPLGTDWPLDSFVIGSRSRTLG